MYRGREGQWAFFLHRISGVAILAFLLLHVLDISLVMWGPEAFNALLGFYHQPIFRLGLLLVIAGVLYHSLNGLRIILMDMTSWGARHQVELWRGVLVLFVVFYLPVLVIALPQIVGGE
jgi:succinate dehydrogenase / fumarate reductase cytochrome b subunit